MIKVKKTARILLVEDNPVDIDLMSEAFKTIDAGVILDVVHDGRAALDFLSRASTSPQSRRPNLIIMDMNLPLVRGIDVLRKLKQSPLHADIPVIILSTSDDKEDVSRFYNEHAACYISKPGDFLELLDLVTMLDRFWLQIVQLPREGKEISR